MVGKCHWKILRGYAFFLGITVKQTTELVIILNQNKSAAGMQHTPPRDENHFETRPFHAKFEENR